MKPRVLLIALVLAALAASSTARASQPHLMVVGGVGGEDYYSELFHRWVETLVDVSTQRLGVPPKRLIRLEAEPSLAGAAKPSRKENVLAAIDRLARTSGTGDVIAIVLLGHGTARGDRALFNLPGPDISAAELAAALDRLAGRTVAVVVAAPSSAPFIDAISGEGRIVVTATATASENQHTRFGGHFIDALADDEADTDKDGRVSVLEAFRLATREVERAFSNENLLRTEHAMLDDNGDGIGSRDPSGDGGDGELAAHTHLVEPAFQPDTATGREALALEIEARRLVDRVEALKRDKGILAPDDYRQRLESLLVELALNRRAYRGLE